MTVRRTLLAASSGFSLALILSTISGCSSTGTVTIPVSVTVSGNLDTRLGSTTQFNATVSGSKNSAVTWEVNGITGGSATTGTISSTGLYTAPGVLLPSPYEVTITAASQASPSSVGTLTENLENPIPIAANGTATEVGSSLSYLIDVTGSGFVPTSVLQINGTAEPTTYVSSGELQATITVTAGTTSVSVFVVNPNPGAANSATLTPSIPTIISLTAAARILDQTTFGPTVASIQQVAQQGITTYLQAQFSATPTLMAQVPNPEPTACANAPLPCVQSEFWSSALTAPDQLRQRVAFALSEMFVVSAPSISPYALPSYQNTLVNDAFGNFFTVMNDVSLSPAMGGYLNMLNSAAAPAGQIANENYPRELMQLFTLGTALLNQDGSQQLDGSGNPIQPYSETQVQAFAKAYTGWTYALAGGGSPTKYPNNTPDYVDSMAPVQAYHDTTSKTLLNGTVLPAGQTAQQDLHDALTNIFNHPNVAPFVCKQLIQHLVTSTPSPAYISRISAVFNNDGTGTRGNLKAVITAILTDSEARAGDTNPSYDGGHLREPVLFLSGFYRGLGYSVSSTATYPDYPYTSLSNYTSSLSENPYSSPSVFNFFAPDYVIPQSTLNAPEFGIENTASVVLRQSLANSAVFNSIGSQTIDLSATSYWGTLAANPTALVNQLSLVFMHSQMPPSMQTQIISTITPFTNNAERARIAIYLVLTSPNYLIIH
jgi:uncharacterized protein (DUF1800 family)